MRFRRVVLCYAIMVCAVVAAVIVFARIREGRSPYDMERKMKSHPAYLERSSVKKNGIGASFIEFSRHAGCHAHAFCVGMCLCLQRSVNRSQSSGDSNSW
jgi:hypothetical protein